MTRIIDNRPIFSPPVINNNNDNTTTNSDKIISPEDRWLNIPRQPLRGINNTPFFLSRVGEAREPEHLEPRLNIHGYDKDDPQDAMIKYENAHPLSWAEKTWNEFTDLVFNLFTACIPKVLSASAGAEKQRISQKVVLNIVRDAVDNFPELKIRISKEAFSLLSSEDQMRWHKMMSIIRQAQHDYITDELAKAYPGHIDQNAPTILYTGGRAVQRLRPIYLSIDEYVAFCWSDWDLVSTDSGSYKAHVYDYITEGKNINWSARPENFNQSDHEITEPGEYTFLGRGDRKIWSFEGPCGMVDHGIGDIISMTKFALVSNFTSTLNMEQVGKLLSTQIKALVYEYGQRIQEAFGSVKVEVQNIPHVTPEELTEARNYFAPIMQKANNL